jgi:hypothetical protein
MRQRQLDAELHDLRQVRPAAARERRGRVVRQGERLAGLAGEIDHQVIPLGGAHQQVAQGHRLGQEALISADLVEDQRLARVVAVDQRHVQEARVAGVEHPEAVLARLHVQVRESLAIDDGGVAEELRNPDRRDRRAHTRVLHRIVQRAVGIPSLKPLLFGSLLSRPAGEVQLEARTTNDDATHSFILNYPHG